MPEISEFDSDYEIYKQKHMRRLKRELGVKSGEIDTDSSESDLEPEKCQGQRGQDHQWVTHEEPVRDRDEGHKGQSSASRESDVTASQQNDVTASQSWEETPVVGVKDSWEQIDVTRREKPSKMKKSVKDVTPRSEKRPKARGGKDRDKTETGKISGDSEKQANQQRRKSRKKRRQTESDHSQTNYLERQSGGRTAPGSNGVAPAERSSSTAPAERSGDAAPAETSGGIVPERSGSPARRTGRGVVRAADAGPSASLDTSSVRGSRPGLGSAIGQVRRSRLVHCEITSQICCSDSCGKNCLGTL